MFSFKEVDNLPIVEANKAIQGTLGGSDIVFEQSLVDAIIEETKGYPFFLQFYGYFLVEETNKNRLSLDDLKRLRPALVKELDMQFFDDRYNLASDKEKKVLTAMAKAGTPTVAALTIRTKAGISHPVLMELLKRLIEKGLVFRASRGKYGFSIPLFREYLLRNE